MKTREEARRRTSAAYYVLRGRPVRPHYGILVVLPLVAGVTGAMVGWYLRSMAGRPEPAGPVRAEPEVPRPEPVAVR